MVAVGMLFVYKIGAIRVTPRFTRILVGATIGVFGLMVVNWSPTCSLRAGSACATTGLSPSASACSASWSPR